MLLLQYLVGVSTDPAPAGIRAHGMAGRGRGSCAGVGEQPCPWGLWQLRCETVESRDRGGSRTSRGSWGSTTSEWPQVLSRGCS